MKINKVICIMFLLIMDILLSKESTRGAETIINKEQLEILPNGRNTGSILENWLSSVVFFQVESGGLSRVDPLRFSSHGISWIEQNFKINGIDITDPSRSGYPLFEPAWDSISGIELKSSQEIDPYEVGIDWEIRQQKTISPFQVSYNHICPFFNASLIPEGKLDREPSFPYGSPKERRRYRFSNEINGSYNFNEKFHLGIETLNTQREFPTLTDESGNMVPEKAGKYLLTSIYSDNNIQMPYTFTLIGQYNHNNNYGANLRLDNKDALTQQNIVNHLQFNAEKRLRTGEIYILSGFTTRYEKLESHLDKPGVIEFDTESGPVPDTGDINRINFDNNLAYKYKYLNIEAGFQINAAVYDPEIPYMQTMQSLNGDIFSVTIWDDPEKCNEYLYNSSIKTEFEKTWRFFTLLSNIYFDNSYALANGKRLLNWYGIGGRIKTKFDIKESNTGFILGILHRPSKINSYLVEFLNNERPSGKTYSGWIDLNGNGIADDSELSGTTLISTTGGRYHHKDKYLKRPYQDELSVGIEQNINKYLKITLQGSHRIFSNYFIVNYESYDGTYTLTPEGYQIYNKPPGVDEYYLSNYSGSRGYYSGAEIQLEYSHGKLYLNFMFSAFMVKGFAPIGNGPDFNDYAAISEDTASPNSRINSSGGRLSNDRAYMANFLFGYKIRKNFSVGITMKYRDGEPFSQYRIYTDSNGMPVKIMDQKRGDWFGEGTGRYTFAWNMDIRLRYNPAILNENTAVTLDIYNVLGSATEILESNKLEDDRKALEAVPQRMIKLGIDMRF